MIDYGYNENFSKSDFVLKPKAREEKAKLLKEMKNKKFKMLFEKVDGYLKHQVFNHTSDLAIYLKKQIADVILTTLTK